MLFKDKDKKEDSEPFENPNIKSVEIQVERELNQVYNKGMRKCEIYKEAVRFFGEVRHPENNIKDIDFYKSKFAFALVDFRTVNEKDLVDTGRRLVDMQAGVLLEISEEATKTTWKYYFLSEELCLQ